MPVVTSIGRSVVTARTGFVVGVAVMLILGRMSDHFETVGGQGNSSQKHTK